MATMLFSYRSTISLFLRFYLFILAERGKEAEKEGEKHRKAASCTRLDPRLVPGPGIKPATLCCAGRCPTNRATPVRVQLFSFRIYFWCVSTTQWLSLELQFLKQVSTFQSPETFTSQGCVPSRPQSPGPQPLSPENQERADLPRQSGCPG